jgi:hypothetical protein
VAAFHPYHSPICSAPLLLHQISAASQQSLFFLIRCKGSRSPIINVFAQLRVQCKACLELYFQFPNWDKCFLKLPLSKSSYHKLANLIQICQVKKNNLSPVEFQSTSDLELAWTWQSLEATRFGRSQKLTCPIDGRRRCSSSRLPKCRP